jgi:hypothetical protein
MQQLQIDASFAQAADLHIGLMEYEEIVVSAGDARFGLFAQFQSQTVYNPFAIARPSGILLPERSHQANLAFVDRVIFG